MWTINQGEDDEEVGGAIAAIRAAEATKTASLDPTTTTTTTRAANQQDAILIQPVVYCASSAQSRRERTPSLASQDSYDVEMSDSSSFMTDSSRAVTPEEHEAGGGMDLDELTPLEGKGRDDAFTPVVVRQGDSSPPSGLMMAL